MIAINTANDHSPLRQYCELLVKLHELIAEGKGDSAEADELRDHLDAPWHDLNEEETRLAKRLSEDLYMLHGSAPLPHPRDDSFTPELSAALTAARNTNDYLRVLELLSDRSSEVGASRAMSLRGSSYEHLGLPDVAIRFFEMAAKLTPDPAQALIGLLHSLSRAGKSEEAVKRALVILDTNTPNDIHLHQFCVLVILEEPHSIAEPVRSQRFVEAKAALERILDRLDATPNADDQKLFCLFLLADCCYMLGAKSDALSHLNQAIRINPNDEGSLVLRGLLMVSEGFADAVKDFSRAIDLGTRAIMPYYYVAHDALASENYDRCIAVAKRGLRIRGEREVLASLHQMAAISLIKKSSSIDALPTHEIRKHFRTAAVLLPFKASFQENCRKFEAMIAQSTLQTWEIGRPIAASRSVVGSAATEYVQAATAAF